MSDVNLQLVDSFVQKEWDWTNEVGERLHFNILKLKTVKDDLDGWLPCIVTIMTKANIIHTRHTVNPRCNALFGESTTGQCISYMQLIPVREFKKHNECKIAMEALPERLYERPTYNQGIEYYSAFIQRVKDDVLCLGVIPCADWTIAEVVIRSPREVQSIVMGDMSYTQCCETLDVN